MSKPAHTILDFKRGRVLSSEQSDRHAYAAERDRIRDLRDSSRMTATPAAAVRTPRRAGC